MANNNNHDHTYGAKCRLAPVTRVDREDEMPPVEAQFFYSSVIPIDDPLSTSSATGPPESRSAKGQLRPFARGDNNALEKGWLSLMSDDDQRAHEDVRRGQPLDARSLHTNSDKLASLIHGIASTHWDRHRSKYQPQDLSMSSHGALPTTPIPACCSELVVDVSEELANTFCALVRKQMPALSLDEVMHQVVLALGRLKEEAANIHEGRPSTVDTTTSRSRAGSNANPIAHPISRIFKTTESRGATSRNQGTPPLNSGIDIKSHALSASHPKTRSPRTQTPTGSPALTRPPVLDDGISGKPFVRVGTPDSYPDTLLPRADSPLPGGTLHEDPHDVVGRRDSEAGTTEMTGIAIGGKHRPDAVDIAVGVSRLHMVSLPTLQMKPIYWSPVNDVAVVMRATWFYR